MSAPKGHCPGCGSDDVPLYTNIIDDQNSPEPICGECRTRIRKIEFWASSIGGIRNDMKRHHIPISRSPAETGAARQEEP